MKSVITELKSARAPATWAAGTPDDCGSVEDRRARERNHADQNHAEAETEDDRTDDQGERGDEAVHHDRSNERSLRVTTATVRPAKATAVIRPAAATEVAPSSATRKK